jgi:hypothetical protein
LRDLELDIDCVDQGKVVLVELTRCLFVGTNLAGIVFDVFA